RRRLAQRAASADGGPDRSVPRLLLRDDRRALADRDRAAAAPLAIGRAVRRLLGLPVDLATRLTGRPSCIATPGQAYCLAIERIVRVTSPVQSMVNAACLSGGAHVCTHPVRVVDRLPVPAHRHERCA